MAVNFNVIVYELIQVLVGGNDVDFMRGAVLFNDACDKIVRFVALASERVKPHFFDHLDADGQLLQKRGRRGLAVGFIVGIDIRAEGLALAIQSENYIIALKFLRKICDEARKPAHHAAGFAVFGLKPAHSVVEPKKKAERIDDRDGLHNSPRI